MRPGSELRAFVAAFLATLLTVVCLIEFRVIERISYEMERGRLQALRESAPASDELALVMWTRRAAELAKPAVVSIETDFAPQRTANADRADEEAPATAEAAAAEDSPGAVVVPQGLGSGFVIDADKGHVLTNAHVVDGAARVTVTLADGRTTQAQVLGSDDDTDLAVLHVDLPELHQLAFGESGEVQVGDDVLAVGNPFGLEGTVSKGIISATDRGYLAVGDRVYMGLLQTDAVITTGNSGGPLLDMHGDVIGINVAMATAAGEYDGIGFAIPADRAKVLVDDLIDGGPGFLGIYAGSVSLRRWRDEANKLGWDEPRGALVTDILKNTAAERAGVKPGDIILAIDDVRIDTIEQLSSLLSDTAPGTQIEIDVWRDRKEMALPATLGRKFAPR